MPGPAPDPSALRRDRKDDTSGWVTLPIEGFTGDVPEFPLPRISLYDIYWSDKTRVKEFDEAGTEDFREAEVMLWERVWRKPQAVQWARLGLELQVAAYVRAFLASVAEDANSGMKTAVLRMEDTLGISVKGLLTLRWRIIADEVTERRTKPATVTKLSASERLKARNAEAG